MIPYKTYLMWIGFSVLLSLGFSMILEWPFSLVAIIGFWMILPFVIRMKWFRKLAKLDKFYGPTDSFDFKFKCRDCGKTHDKLRCPTCGSRNKGLV